MNSLIQSIYQSRTVTGRSGKVIPLHSEIDSTEGEFIHRIISRDSSISKTLEVGCAYGLSSLHICEALRSRPDPKHIIIDPFQNRDWDGVGIKNLEEAGVRFHELIEKRSEFALPELLSEGEERLDFVFIDGWHTFDHTLLDCFYANRLLRTGGYLVIDDIGMAAVARVVDYLTLYPCYQVHDMLGNPHRDPLKRKAKKALLSLFPPAIRRKLFNPAGVRRIFEEEEIRMIALKKIGRDERPWDWFSKDF